MALLSSSHHRHHPSSEILGLKGGERCIACTNKETEGIHLKAVCFQNKGEAFMNFVNFMLTSLVISSHIAVFSVFFCDAVRHLTLCNDIAALYFVHDV